MLRMLHPMTRFGPLFGVVLAAGGMFGCGSQSVGSVSAPTHPARTHRAPSHPLRQTEELGELEHDYANAKPIRSYAGKATYYAKSLEGHRMASGETYDPTRAQAAHRTLPFGTVVRVTDLKSGKAVVVRITDRGPYGKGRIIDLSHSAAERIGLLRAGVTEVRLDVLDVP